jgi:hypothetical protein
MPVHLVLETLFAIGVIYFTLTQILLPLLNNTRLFPWFRGPQAARRLQDEFVEVRTEQQVEQMAAKVRAARERLEQLRQGENDGTDNQQ